MELVKDPLPIVDGHILPPNRPGLRVEIDEEACARRAPDFAKIAGSQVVRGYGAYHPDGGVADS